MNYYQIHRNKKPRVSIRKKITNADVYALMALSGAMGATQVAVLNAQQTNNKSDKQKAIIKQVMNTANIVVEIMDIPRQRKFAKTGWYGLKKGDLAKRRAQTCDNEP